MTCRFLTERLVEVERWRPKWRGEKNSGSREIVEYYHPHFSPPSPGERPMKPRYTQVLMLLILQVDERNHSA